ncbi:MAG: hypothetical protein QXS02_00045 [Candidatus Thermoplasmatota archaeon]
MEELTFRDGILLCKYIYQCAIHKSLQGVMEEWEIFQKTHDILSKLEENMICTSNFSKDACFDKKRLDELLFYFNLDDIYAVI